MVLAVLISRNGGYNGADECGSCRTWKVQLSGRKKKGVHQMGTCKVG